MEVHEQAPVAWAKRLTVTCRNRSTFLLRIHVGAAQWGTYVGHKYLYKLCCSSLMSQQFILQPGPSAIAFSYSTPHSELLACPRTAEQIRIAGQNCLRNPETPFKHMSLFCVMGGKRLINWSLTLFFFIF